MNRTLFELSEDLARIEDSLYESGGELTPEMEAQLTETKEGLVLKADGYGTLIRKFRSFADGCKSEIDRLTKLKKTAENAEKRMKAHILDAMNKFGYDRLEGGTTRFIKGKSPKSLEVEEELLLSAYKDRIEALQSSLPDYLTVEVKVSKKAIGEAAKGAEVLPPGCVYQQHDTLTMK